MTDPSTQVRERPLILLASSSPQRRELISRIFKDHETFSPDADETVDASLSIDDALKAIASRKAHAAEDLASAVASCKESGRPYLVLAADTVVVSGDDILGKPEDRADAVLMLESLSGRAHRVVTGVSILTADREEISFASSSDVIFRELSEDEILSYIDTGEPFDKAGAYSIQGIAGLFVKEIRGDFFNIVGLPVSAVYEAALTSLPEIYRDELMLR